MADLPILLTIKEAAEYLHIGESTLYRLIKSGALQRPFKVGRAYRFRLEYIDAWRHSVEARRERQTKGKGEPQMPNPNDLTEEEVSAYQDGVTDMAAELCSVVEGCVADAQDRSTTQGILRDMLTRLAKTLRDKEIAVPEGGDPIFAVSWNDGTIETF